MLFHNSPQFCDRRDHAILASSREPMTLSAHPLFLSKFSSGFGNGSIICRSRPFATQENGRRHRAAGQSGDSYRHGMLIENRAQRNSICRETVALSCIAEKDMAPAKGPNQQGDFLSMQTRRGFLAQMPALGAAATLSMRPAPMQPEVSVFPTPGRRSGDTRNMRGWLGTGGSCLRR